MTHITSESKLKRLFKAKDTSPAILLDIDGVISPMGGVEGLKRKSRQVQFSNFAVTDRVERFFSRLSHDNVDVIWASTWEEESLVLGQELGIRDSGYLELGGMHEQGTWFKENAVKNFISKNGHRKIVWLDDEIPDDLIKWAKENHSSILVERVEPMAGVETNLMKKILSFLEEKGS